MIVVWVSETCAVFAPVIVICVQIVSLRGSVAVSRRILRLKMKWIGLIISLSIVVLGIFLFASAPILGETELRGHALFENRCRKIGCNLAVFGVIASAGMSAWIYSSHRKTR